MIDDNLRYSGTIPDERLHDMRRDLRSPMGGGHGGSGGSGPRGAGVFLVDQVFTRSQDDTYQATKSVFLNPLHKASYGVRIGDIVLFYLNTEGILCTGIVTAISGETVTFVKHDEISTVGFSPSIATTDIPGGHRVTVTNEGGSESFDVMDGVQGPQGEPFEFDDFTQAQLDELRSDVASVYYRKQEATVITFNDVSTIGIPFDNFTFADMLFVDIEGLALTENQDYVINGSTIELNTPITHPNTRINFKLLTIMAITSEDLDTLLEGLADFNGATDSADGTHGLVPASAAGDDLDVLFGNGEWGALNLTTFSWGNDQSISIQANFDNEQAPSALFGSTSLPLASATKAGLMKLEDYSKLQGIQAGAQANVIESISVNGTAVDVNNKNAAISIPQASSDSAGLMAASDKTKLDTISAFSSDNKAALFADGIWWHLFNEMTTNGHLLLKRGRSTGGATPRPIIETIDDMPMYAASEYTPGLMTVSDKTKLDGIEAGANAYTLPTATTSRLGGVKPDGTTVTVDNDGTIHAAGSGTIPDGSITGVKIADDTIPDAKLAQTGGVLETISTLIQDLGGYIDKSEIVQLTNTYGYYIISSGAIVTVSGNYGIKRANVVAGETYYVTASSNWSNPFYAWYDDNDNLIQLGPSSAAGSAYSSITNEEAIAPSGATKIVINWNTASVEAELTHYLGKAIAKKWYGKKWACVGDSLTDYNQRTTKHYFDYVRDATDIQPINMGDSGTGYARQSENNRAFYQRILSIDTSADVVTIFGSFNDLSAGISLGTYTDTDTDTIAGCINQTITNLQSVMPTAVLGIVAPTPWQSTQPTPNSAADNYVNMLKSICEHRSIPFLDLYRESNLRPWDADFRALCYSKDDGYGTHPDELGHKLIAPRFKAFLETLLI